MTGAQVVAHAADELGVGRPSPSASRIRSAPPRAEPIGLTPIFYLWPMLVAAYFVGRREVAANFALVAATCGVALLLWSQPVLRLAMFMAVLAIVGVVTGVAVVLREQVLASCCGCGCSPATTR